jgi:thiol:disulfide interchange protein DsbD
MLRRTVPVVAALVLGIAQAAAQPVSPDDLLEPEKAFRISAQPIDERTVAVEFKIAEGYYMYRDRFSFATADGRRLAEVEIPRGVLKEDAFFGKTETFRDLVRMRVPVSAEDAAKGSVALKVTSQGCSDLGVCYTPQEQMVKVRLPRGGQEVGASTFSVRPLGDALARLPWTTLAASLGAGLALAWASAGAPVRRPAFRHAPRQIFRVAAFGLAGALAAWAGAAIGPLAANPWVPAPLALLFTAFGALWIWRAERPRPAGWAAWEGRDLLLMAAALLFALYSGDIALGIGLALGAGVATRPLHGSDATPLDVLARHLVALAMLAAAVWIVAPLLSDLFRMLAWSAWLFAAAGLLRAIDPLPEGAPGALRIAKALGVAALVAAVAVFVGAVSGARDPLQPLSKFRAAAEVPSPLRTGERT